MNDRAASILTSKVKIGATASAAGGPVGRESAAATVIPTRRDTHTHAPGSFAGVSRGSTLRPVCANQLYGKMTRNECAQGAVRRHRLHWNCYRC
jgi:lipid-binding SYLF domain-containing protein